MVMVVVSVWMVVCNSFGVWFGLLVMVVMNELLSRVRVVVVRVFVLV